MDSQRAVCYLLLAAGAGREEGAINLSSGGFRPPDLLLPILPRSLGEKM